MTAKTTKATKSAPKSAPKTTKATKTPATGVQTMPTTAPVAPAARVISTPSAATPAKSSVLMAACNQWMTRPADQRFGSLEDLHAAVTHHREVAVEVQGVDLRSLSIETRTFTDASGATVAEPVLLGATDTPARFTNHGFNQLTRRIGAPAGYLTKLPPELAALNMNHGLQSLEEGTADRDSLLFAKNGDLRLRADLSKSYKRIWNADITSRLLRLNAEHPEWQPAPAAFDGSRGLYASDSDMFAFMVDNDRRIFETGPAGGLARGFFVGNSEVGDGSFFVTTFLYEYVCGNHRVWGATGVQELRIRHVGNADDRAFEELSVELTKYADGSAAEDNRKVAAAMKFSLGGTKDEVLDRVFGFRDKALSQKVIAAAYDMAETHSEWYGDPRTMWGFTGGLTQVARDLPIAADRIALERSAGKLMSVAF